MLRERINELRELLNDLIDEQEQNTDSVLKASRELDALIMEYCNNIADKD